MYVALMFRGGVEFKPICLKASTFLLCSLGKNPQFVEGVVPSGSVPQPLSKAPPGPGDGAHAHAGGQLVQEPAPKGPRRVRKEQVGGHEHCMDD